MTIDPKLVSAALSSAAACGWTVAAGRVMRQMLINGDFSYDACVTLGSHGIQVNIMNNNEFPSVVVTKDKLIVGL
jgi:translation initiation factor 1 (eIF-1/SUI1)